MKKAFLDMESAMLKILSALFISIFFVLLALNAFMVLNWEPWAGFDGKIKFGALLLLVSTPWIRVVLGLSVLFQKRLFKLGFISLLSLVIIGSAIYFARPSG